MNLMKALKRSSPTMMKRPTLKNFQSNKSFKLDGLDGLDGIEDVDNTSSTFLAFNSSFLSLASEQTFALDSAEDYRKTCSDAEQVECIEKLVQYCVDSGRSISHHLLMRYAVYYNFDFEKSRAAINKGYTYSYLYLELEAGLLRFIMKEKIFFPLPGLKSRKSGSDCFYFRPSRYLPSSTNNGLLLDNLCYVLNDMSRTVEQCQNGVVMIVNMDGYSMKNFHGETQMKMTRITEGHVIPTRIVEVLIVNPPRFFLRLWKMVRPAFSSNFKRRIRLVKDDKLGNYLMDGYEKYFPDEFLDGYVSTSEIVDDFIDLKLYEEEQCAL